MKIRDLAGWYALPKAAEHLGLTKQGLWFRVNQGQIPMKFLRQVRTGKSRVVLVAESYVLDQQLENESGSGE